MRALAISLTIVLCTSAPSLFAQYTMGGMGGGMGMGGMPMGGMGGGMGMGGMGMGGMPMGGGMMMRYAPVTYGTGMSTRAMTGMTTVRPKANVRYQPSLVDWRRTLRLRQPIMFNRN